MIACSHSGNLLLSSTSRNEVKEVAWVVVPMRVTVEGINLATLGTLLITFT